MQIRRAKPQEARRIKEIISQLDTENYNFSHLSKIKKYIKRKDCYVVIDKKKILGAMVLDWRSTEACELKFLVADAKRQGVGKALIEYAIDFCRKKKIVKLWCWSLLRYNAKGFYKKVGFEEDFVMKRQWYGEDSYIFGKVI